MAGGVLEGPPPLPLCAADCEAAPPPPLPLTALDALLLAHALLLPVPLPALGEAVGGAGVDVGVKRSDAVGGSELHAEKVGAGAVPVAPPLAVPPSPPPLLPPLPLLTVAPPPLAVAGGELLPLCSGLSVALPPEALALPGAGLALPLLVTVAPQLAVPPAAVAGLALPPPPLLPLRTALRLPLLLPLDVPPAAWLAVPLGRPTVAVRSGVLVSVPVAVGSAREPEGEPEAEPVPAAPPPPLLRVGLGGELEEAVLLAQEEALRTALPVGCATLLEGRGVVLAAGVPLLPTPALPADSLAAMQAVVVGEALGCGEGTAEPEPTPRAAVSVPCAVAVAEERGDAEAEDAALLVAVLAPPPAVAVPLLQLVGEAAALPPELLVAVSEGVAVGSGGVIEGSEEALVMLLPAGLADAPVLLLPEAAGSVAVACALRVASLRGLGVPPPPPPLLSPPVAEFGELLLGMGVRLLGSEALAMEEAVVRGRVPLVVGLPPSPPPPPLVGETAALALSPKGVLVPRPRDALPEGSQGVGLGAPVEAPELVAASAELPLMALVAVGTPPVGLGDEEAEGSSEGDAVAEAGALKSAELLPVNALLALGEPKAETLGAKLVGVGGVEALAMPVASGEGVMLAVPPLASDALKNPLLVELGVPAPRSGVGVPRADAVSVATGVAEVLEVGGSGLSVGGELGDREVDAAALEEAGSVGGAVNDALAEMLRV